MYAKCESYYEFVAKTNKVLKMNRVVLKNKQDEKREIQTIDDQEEENPIEAESYQAALDKLLRPGRPAPRQIANDETNENDDDAPDESMEVDSNQQQNTNN